MESTSKNQYQFHHGRFIAVALGFAVIHFIVVLFMLTMSKAGHDARPISNELYNSITIVLLFPLGWLSNNPAIPDSFAGIILDVNSLLWGVVFASLIEWLSLRRDRHNQHPGTQH